MAKCILFHFKSMIYIPRAQAIAFTLICLPHLHRHRISLGKWLCESFINQSLWVFSIMHCPILWRLIWSDPCVIIQVPKLVPLHAVYQLYYVWHSVNPACSNLAVPCIHCRSRRPPRASHYRGGLSKLLMRRLLLLCRCMSLSWGFSDNSWGGE